MSTEKIRHDFEQFIIQRDGLIWITDKGESRSYDEHIERDFSVWCASRAAIEVELPEGLTLNEMRYGSKPKSGHERLLPRTTCVKAIESLGLKVRT